MAGPVSPELWYAALAAQCGIIIKTDDPTFIKQKLYALRKELGDPDLENIALMTSPHDPNEIWLVKKVRDVS